MKLALAAGVATTLAAATAHAADEPVEVTISGEKKEPGESSSLARSEVRLLPGAFGDPFRAVEAMPGVTPIASGIPYFFVRGAPPGNVGYFVDGIRVPLLFHLGLGPSVVNPALIDRVDLFPGGYPARFGRFAGGIVAGETRPPAEKARGEAQLRVVDAGAFLEVPFADGRGTALAGGRYSYTSLLLSLLNPDVDLAYWDYQARITYELSPSNRLTAFAFGSYDYFNGTGGTFADTFFDTTFHRLDLRYDKDLGGGSSLRHAITLGLDTTKLEKDRKVLDRMIGSRTEYARVLSDGSIVRAGADVVLDSDDADLRRDEPPGDPAQESFEALFRPRADLQAGVRGDITHLFSPRFEVTAGARFDFYASGGRTAFAVDPRLSARVAITPWLRILEAHGLASQMPSFFLPGPGFQPDLTGGLQHSAQTSGGLEADLPGAITASATFFYDIFFNMTDALGSSPVTGTGKPPDDFARRSNGSTVGLELSAHRRLTKRLGGFIAYTLSRSIRTVGVVTRPASFDRTHVLNVALAWDFTHGFRGGIRSVFYTGYPRSPAAFPVPDALAHPDRIPAFFRLDWRLEKRWTIGESGYVSAVAEMLNTTLAKEVVSVECAAPNQCSENLLGPVTIPSVGLEGGF